MNQGQRRTLQGVHFLNLKGSLAERGRIHAALLKNEIQKGAFWPLALKNEQLVQQAPGALGVILQLPLVRSLILNFYRKVLIPFVASGLKKDERSLYRAIAQELGVPDRVCYSVLYQSDMMMVLARTSLMKYLLNQWPEVRGGGSLLGVPGCTSAVVLRDWSLQKKMLACRNLDYPIVGPWEEQTTVLFHEPTESDSIPYVCVTSAGIHTGGLTSLNREGVSLFTHAHFGRKVSLRGRAIFVVGDEVARKAKTIGQAVDLVKKSSRCGNWAFIVASAKENNAVVIEMTPDKVKVREPVGGFIAHSNAFQDEELRKTEALLCGGYYQDLESRLCRIQQCLAPFRGNLEVRHMTMALGDKVDEVTGQERVLGNTVGVVTTVQSVVFELENQKFWISYRGESPTGFGAFMSVDIEQFWKKTQEECESSLEVTLGYQPQNKNIIESMRHYRHAYRLHHVQERPLGESLDALKKSLELYPSDGHVWIQAGLVAFKLQSFEVSKAFFESPYVAHSDAHALAVKDLYLARCFDLMGRRDDALKCYYSHSDLRDQKLKDAFEKGKKKPYNIKEIRNMMLDLQFPDVFCY